MSDPTCRQASRLLTLIGEQGCSSEQLQQLFDSGFLSDLFEAASLGYVGGLSRVDFQEFLTLSLHYEPAQTVDLEGIPEEFDIRRLFKEADNLSFTESEFSRLFFGDLEGFPVIFPPTSLNYAKLRRNLRTREVFDRVSRDRNLVNLPEIWQLLSKQLRGEEGQLLTNRSSSGPRNIFFVYDKLGTITRVDLFLAPYDSRVSGWILTVADDSLIKAGSRVFYSV